MTRDEAKAVLKRIAGTWSDLRLNTYAEESWLEELAALDAEVASAALARLRKELERAPSIARFVKEAGGAQPRLPIIEPPSDKPPGAQTGIALSDYLARCATPREAATVAQVRLPRPLRGLRKLQDLEVSEVESSEARP